MKKSRLISTCLGWTAAAIIALVVFSLWSELVKSAWSGAESEVQLVLVVLGIEIAFTACGLVSGLLIQGQDVLSSALLAGVLSLLSLAYILGFNPLILVLSPLCAALGGFGGLMGQQVRSLITRRGSHLS